jgi:hypothetical protein
MTSLAAAVFNLAVELAKEKGNDQPMKCLLIALI